MKKNSSTTTLKDSKHNSVGGVDAKARTKSTKKSLKNTLTARSTQVKQAKKIGAQRKAFFRPSGWKEYIEIPFKHGTSASFIKRAKYAWEILKG